MEIQKMKQNHTDKIKKCPYAGKCPDVRAYCYRKRPKMYSIDGRRVACFLYTER